MEPLEHRAEAVRRPSPKVARRGRLAIVVGALAGVATALATSTSSVAQCGSGAERAACLTSLYGTTLSLVAAGVVVAYVLLVAAPLHLRRIAAERRAGFALHVGRAPADRPADPLLWSATWDRRLPRRNGGLSEVVRWEPGTQPERRPARRVPAPARQTALSVVQGGLRAAPAMQRYGSRPVRGAHGSPA